MKSVTNITITKVPGKVDWWMGTDIEHRRKDREYVI